MSRRDPEALAARRAAMREKLAARPGKEAMAARVAEQRAAIEARRASRPKKDKKKRRPWWLLILLLLLILFCARDCSCTEPVPVEAPAEADPAGPPDEPEAPLPGGKIPRKDRPELIAMPKPNLPWIAAFRMQVSARSPRLAECFEGTDRPGRLKWTTSVEPVEGRVSEHVIEPVLLSQELNAKQRACLTAVLSDPPYQLESGSEPATPSRVGITIEF